MRTPSSFYSVPFSYFEKMAEVPMAPNVTLIFGPMLIGVFFNMILYGILIVQTYHYYLSYKGHVQDTYLSFLSNVLLGTSIG